MTEFTQKDWLFKEPENVAVFTTTGIVLNQHPILYVFHDSDDGSWQFQSGEEVLEIESKVVSLSRIVKLDPSVKELANLPLGWIAIRESPDQPWKRFQMEDDNSGYIDDLNS